MRPFSCWIFVILLSFLVLHAFQTGNTCVDLIAVATWVQGVPLAILAAEGGASRRSTGWRYPR